MQCYIYRSSIKEGLYVYLANENGLETLPKPVLKQLGTPEFAMQIDVTPTRKLGQEDAGEVVKNLETQGFHIQMPRDIEGIVAEISREASDNSNS